jgi:restriction system protein
LLSKKAKKGVFITTTNFSKDALDYVKELDFKIILISGSQLAGLMLKHNLGVTTSKTILIKKMDSDYFEEE